MPWSLDRRDGRWCVIKDSDGSTAGCHDSRADAIKQQRALYANESRVASMYAELDAIQVSEPELEIPGVDIKPGSELVKIEIGKEHDALIASLSDRMEAMAIREQETQRALVAALQQMGLRDPVVHVDAPNVNVEQPAITVEAAPPAEVKVDVHVPEQAAPQVHVSPEIHLPETPPAAVTRTITFERDPLTDLVSKAEVSEQ